MVTIDLSVENEEQLEVSEENLDKEQVQTPHGEKANSKQETPLSILTRNQAHHYHSSKQWEGGDPETNKKHG